MRWFMAIVVVLASVAVSSVRAHEIGTTQVHATFLANGTYRFDVVTEPGTLLKRLERAAGLPLSAALSSDERDRRIARLGQTFLATTILTYDGERVAPVFTYVAPNSGALATARLTGRVPPGARRFTWSCALIATAYPLQVGSDVDPTRRTVWIDGEATSPSDAVLAPSRLRVRAAIARQYLFLGFTHILPKGLDHILFVIGLFLLTTRTRSMLVQVSAFTIAHSITLALTMYGLASLPSRVVETGIALSIGYIAIENLFTREVGRFRPLVVFGFGLLHGMGFAGVLTELGLPRSEFVTALLTFNLGVEAGQLAIILLAFAAVAYWRRDGAVYRRFIVQPASVLIALAGAYWTVLRAFGT
ncbi:MAG: HupE/UreJ family protein [Vicinamibacterales bacterium]